VDASLAGLVSLTDGSTLWQPRLTVSVSDNADLAAYAWISSGPSPVVTLAAADPPVRLRFRSEFGAVPDGGGLYARWFF
jgi:hypothetical protein